MHYRIILHHTTLRQNTKPYWSIKVQFLEHILLLFPIQQKKWKRTHLTIIHRTLPYKMRCQKTCNFKSKFYNECWEKHSVTNATPYNYQDKQFLIILTTVWYWFWCNQSNRTERETNAMHFITQSTDKVIIPRNKQIITCCLLWDIIWDSRMYQNTVSNIMDTQFIQSTTEILDRNLSWLKDVHLTMIMNILIFSIQNDDFCYRVLWHK